MMTSDEIVDWVMATDTRDPATRGAARLALRIAGSMREQETTESGGE